MPANGRVPIEGDARISGVEVLEAPRAGHQAAIDLEQLARHLRGARQRTPDAAGAKTGSPTGIPSSS